MDSTMISAIATFILAFFAAGSAIAAAWTALETKKLRKDSLRPLLVPCGGNEGISHTTKMPKLDDSGDLLQVHNIGMGPSENISIRLELRSGKNSPTVQLDEMWTNVEPLASDEKAIVFQRRATEKPYEIYDDHWIVVSYDDIFHRHFETEARRIKMTNDWVSIKTIQVKKLRPRIRETDYYSNAFGNNQVKK
ncbi:MAG: hypothetical protein JXA46_15860 [Dehalococcoidales bacterium]|nr:hypothetical protein [Dehalococcoidales bacterium]